MKAVLKALRKSGLLRGFAGAAATALVSKIVEELYDAAKRRAKAGPAS